MRGENTHITSTVWDACLPRYLPAYAFFHYIFYIKAEIMAEKLYTTWKKQLCLKHCRCHYPRSLQSYVTVMLLNHQYCCDKIIFQIQVCHSKMSFISNNKRILKERTFYFQHALQTCFSSQPPFISVRWSIITIRQSQS